MEYGRSMIDSAWNGRSVVPSGALAVVVEICHALSKLSSTIVFRVCASCLVGTPRWGQWIGSMVAALPDTVFTKTAFVRPRIVS